MLNKWNLLPRYEKSKHIFRTELSVLLLLVGIVTFGSDPTVGTYRAINEHFPFGIIGFGIFSIICGILINIFRKANVLHFFVLSGPMVLACLFNLQAIILGYTGNPILFVLNGILVIFLLTVYWGYT